MSLNTENTEKSREKQSGEQQRFAIGSMVFFAGRLFKVLGFRESDKHYQLMDGHGDSEWWIHEDNLILAILTKQSNNKEINNHGKEN